MGRDQTRTGRGQCEGSQHRLGGRHLSLIAYLVATVPYSKGMS